MPDPSLILLIGPSGSGKSTLARRLFGPFETVSSDLCRGLVSNDPSDQRASGDAFRLLHTLVKMRCTRGVLTVVDATNVTAASRRPLRRIAHSCGIPCGALVLDLPEDGVRARNAARPGRAAVPDRVVTLQLVDFAEALLRLPDEGFDVIHRIAVWEMLDAVTIERQPFVRAAPEA